MGSISDLAQAAATAADKGSGKPSKAAVGMAKLGNDEHARNGDEIWVGGHAGTGRGEAR